MVPEAEKALVTCLLVLMLRIYGITIRHQRLAEDGGNNHTSPEENILHLTSSETTSRPPIDTQQKR